ncbi:MAG: dehydrogenase [Verrucomicrobiales bacterium]|nr:dehydrogenase [Verrucomicrobiales bacterium]
MRSLPLLILLASLPLHAAEVSEADKRIVQTVQRMSAFDFAKANPKTQEAINRYLDATAGTDEFFMLVEKYRITTQAGTLVRLLTEQAGTPRAGEAVKLLLKLGQQESVRATLKGLAPDAAGALLESIAAVGSQEAVALVIDAVRDPAAPAAAAVRAVKSLGLGSAGQKALLEAARAGTLPDAVRDTAGTALTTSTDAAIRDEAAAIFKMAAKAPLAPVAELAKKTGDATKGQTVFMTYCFTCHQVAGVGIDFGPALTEIGSKLAKEAIYDSILNPSAGISFGFEGFEVKTKTGETFVGMVASDTVDELALKLPGGVIQKIGKPALASKNPLGVSLMTPGLHTVMEESQLVDLVEYLSGLKKKN